MSYWDLARERVLHPLGMSRSGDLPTSVLAAPNRAWDLDAFAPAGGLRASVPDMLRLARVAADSANSPFPAAAALALSPQAAMGAGRVGWCWMLSQRKHCQSPKSPARITEVVCTRRWLWVYGRAEPRQRRREMAKGDSGTVGNASPMTGKTPARVRSPAARNLGSSLW